MFVTYLWPDGTFPTRTIRGKTKVLAEPEGEEMTLPDWNFDGSSTGQATVRLPKRGQRRLNGK